MARYGQRPENALKRASEFMDLDKPARALDTLQEVFRNKKWAYNWSESVLEPIMFKYLELCVDLRKSHIAKEGLFQYRNMFQSVNVGSLEQVIRGYLRMAEERTEAARAQSTQAVIETDDLDNLATPESILLSAVSGEDAQDRSDRTILTPWVKFLWESYCQCLELLRTNAHVETLYHDIARMAFQFCLKYSRKTEFRKLCDKLRKHLEDICKPTVQTGNVSISKPETQQLNLETRLFQLDSAIQMELWQEAYKAIEDIHNLMNMSKKTPVAKTMANYYGKLALVFWKAGHCLFHAAALLKLFQLSREMKKNITQEELQKMACRVLVAVLSVPLPSLHPEFDRFVETDKSPVEKAQRLAVLLGLAQPPTRTSLLKDVVRLNVVALASPQLQQLYSWLEVEFDPLAICHNVKGVIKSLQEEPNSPLAQYTSALNDVALVRLIRQVAQCYACVQFARLLQLAATDDLFHLERLLVDCVRHNDMQIRVDHANKCVHFGVEAGGGEWCSAADEACGGAILQATPAEQVREQLVRAAEVLSRAVTTLFPERQRAARERARAHMVQHYHENKHAEHARVLQRHKIIEERKEYIERLNTVREEEELRRQEEQLRAAAAAEARRLEQEREEREKRKHASELAAMKERHRRERMAHISQTAHGKKMLQKLDEEEIKKMDAEAIAQREAEELMKERRELQARLKSQEKKVDYFERAKRLEEIPLLQKSLEEKQVQDKAFWEQQEKERIQQLIEARSRDVATATRLARMHEHRDEFIARLQAERGAAHHQRLAAFRDKLAAERDKRLAERRRARREQRRQEWLAEKQREEERIAEEARRAKEEEERREREERERRQAEELAAQREREREKEKEHLEMLSRQEAKARAKEADVQRKLEEQKAATMSSWRRGGAPESKEDAGGGWRSKTDSKAPEKKPEPWRPSRLREGPREDRVRSPERGRVDRPRDDRSREDRPPPPREDRREDRPRDDRSREDRPLRDDRPRDDRPRDDRPRDEGGWRSANREPERERPRYGGRSSGPDAGTWRRGPAEPPPSAERPSAWRSKDGPPRDDRFRDGPRRDDRDGPRRDDRDGPRRDDRDGPRRDDRDGPRRDDRDFRDRDRYPPRDGPRRDDRDGPRRDDRDGPRRDDRDRRPPPPRRDEKPRDPDGDDWQPVTRR
ncbi:eukaryotic translation initiation factor 3 subunit A-like isoform X4 [Ostrinia furnacalis]|uniref:eukaryotic translation initiation factor 3 subunit A-like isoform X1 n=1 Tax=Ostrinia furnacalis TaxID=93504 RepID=UPI0010388BE9|nr:eukaryotic translation initiation factor 3 subunit A-like isoform X1 [Ostrinia furnacalis]XP_028173593.1 eukaryotic translation initiation factor 3 subunit A-like isoform X2 [Ostrinia furnacalis]XP_028173594.1 eukaryotic translation initiation factor 3 subunit A-like isoform X3 [Ostrinia furnacalis]XP_028173595.1 eukaryotic translation initiation factor 3 subunit A-like isoform X4 [Ostrinia furnacalis]